MTASIASMLVGAEGSELLTRRALTALEPQVSGSDEPYTLASFAIAAAALHDEGRVDSSVQKLRSLAHTENGGNYWSLETNTPFYSWGRAGMVESTAQVMRALLGAGAGPEDTLVAGGFLFLQHEADRHNVWYSTQTTARVLDVLPALALREPGNVTDSPASWRIDGGTTTTIPLPAADKDAGPIFIQLPALGRGMHRIEFRGGGPATTAQVTAMHYRPWASASSRPSFTNNEQLKLTVAYSDSNATPEKTIEARVHAERIGFRGYGMMIAEVGLPPGADVDRASLEAGADRDPGEINHYEVMPDKVLFYVWPTAGGLNIHFRLKLRYRINAFTAPSDLYDYYNPDVRTDTPPIHIFHQVKTVWQQKTGGSQLLRQPRVNRLLTRHGCPVHRSRAKVRRRWQRFGARPWRRGAGSRAAVV